MSNDIEFDDRIIGLRDSVVARLGIRPSESLSNEIAYALLVACGMQHPGVTVLLIRPSAARIVYHRRHMIKKLKELGHDELAKEINGRRANDDDLIVVELATEAATPRSCVLDIGRVRMKQYTPTLPRPQGPWRTL